MGQLKNICMCPHQLKLYWHSFISTLASATKHSIMAEYLGNFVAKIFAAAFRADSPLSCQPHLARGRFIAYAAIGRAGLGNFGRLDIGIYFFFLFQI